ncbi:MAG: hypothetical protein R3F29_05485 [Planctomycetota bacterium]
MPIPPSDDHAALVPFTPRAERRLRVFGGEVSLVLAPERARRPGRVGPDRPALAPSRAARIVAEEALWRDEGLVVTPNLHPFGRRHRLLWMAAPVREPDAAFWTAALDWAEREQGSVLLNNIGSAATIARAHAHLLAERQTFLAALPERPLVTPPIEVPEGCELVQKNVPFCAVGARGAPAAVATALVRLAEARLTPSWNVVAEAGVAWVLPRHLETPTPWFPLPLGAAELWGRWCHIDEEMFLAASGADLEQALVDAVAPALD